MRATTSFRLLLVPAALLGAAACDDSALPLEAPAAGAEAPTIPEGSAAVAGPARWADGYMLAESLTNPSYRPSPNLSYNRSGGGILITKPANTTGRYVVTFSGLSALLGARSTVHAGGYGTDNTHCKPVGGYLVNDKIEVRCFNTATGAPANALFTLLVLRTAAARAFAYAHQPTATNYAPQAKGSWNPAGTIRIVRAGTGYYQVTFNGLGSRLPPSVGGHVQVHAVGTGTAHCKVAEEWGGSPNLHVYVQCWDRAGLPVDAKFAVLFHLPAAHLAYAYGYQRSSTVYAPSPFWSSNPAGGATDIRRVAVGVYQVTWQNVDPEILGVGNVQVTPVGVNESGHCKFITVGFSNGAEVRCFTVNGTPADADFTVLLGS